MYVSPNYKTKKQLKEAIAAGRKVEVFNPGPGLGGNVPPEGKFCVEGPHYPEPHKWYAQVTVKDGFVVSVK